MTELQRIDLWYIFPGQTNRNQIYPEKKNILRDFRPPGNNSIALPCGNYVGHCTWEKKQTLVEETAEENHRGDTLCSKQLMVLREKSWQLNDDLFLTSSSQRTSTSFLWKLSIVIHPPTVNGVCKLFRWQVHKFTYRWCFQSIPFCLSVKSRQHLSQTFGPTSIITFSISTSDCDTTLRGFCFKREFCLPPKKNKKENVFFGRPRWRELLGINRFSGLCGGVILPLTPFNNSGLNAAVAVGVDKHFVPVKPELKMLSINRYRKKNVRQDLSYMLLKIHLSEWK